MEMDAKAIKIPEATFNVQKERSELLGSQQEMMHFTSMTESSDSIVNECITIMRKRSQDRLKASKTSPTAPETALGSVLSGS